MRWRQVALALALVVPAVALEYGFLAGLRLPGATPDLLVVVVGSLAATCGAGVGAVSGFAGGMLLDLAPPADGLPGTWAALFTLIGYVIGSRDSLVLRGRLVVVLEVATAGVASVLGRMVLGGILGDPRVEWNNLPTLVMTEFLYALILAPFAMWLIVRLARRLGASTETRPA